MATVDIKVKADEDWLALNVYRMALERIVEQGREEPWRVSDEALIAETVLREFPGSFGRGHRGS